MGRNPKRNRRRRRSRRDRLVRTTGNDYMLTVVNGPANEPCDCPICQIMGIDLTAVDGIDVRPIDEEQLAMLEAALKAEGERN